MDKDDYDIRDKKQYIKEYKTCKSKPRRQRERQQTKGLMSN